MAKRPAVGPTGTLRPIGDGTAFLLVCEKHPDEALTIVLDTDSGRRGIDLLVFCPLCPAAPLLLRATLGAHRPAPEVGSVTSERMRLT